MAKLPTTTTKTTTATTSSNPPTMTTTTPHKEEQFEDAPINQGLINNKRKSIRQGLHHYYDTQDRRQEWMRPYWLGFNLFLLLLAFWMLDSLKDPLFARLVDGKIERHQPTAKIVSVATTLLLVCLMEYTANWRQHQAEQERAKVASPRVLWNLVVLGKP